MNLTCLYEAQLAELIDRPERRSDYTHVSESYCRHRQGLIRLNGYPKQNVHPMKHARMSFGERQEAQIRDAVVRWSHSPICKYIFSHGLRVASRKIGKKFVPLIDTHQDNPKNPTWLYDKKTQLGGRLDAILEPCIKSPDEHIALEIKFVNATYFSELYAYFEAGLDLFDTFHNPQTYKWARSWPGQGAGYNYLLNQTKWARNVHRGIFAIASDNGLILCCLVDYDEYPDLTQSVLDAANMIKDVVNGELDLEELYKTNDTATCFDCPFYRNPCIPTLEANGDTIDESENDRLNSLVKTCIENEPAKIAYDNAREGIRDMLQDKITENEIVPGETTKKAVLCKGATVVIAQEWRNETNPQPQPAKHIYKCYKPKSHKD